ncbi:hypothetical protein [Paraburkholderia sp. SIMBA_054]|uniref:hypothetical protein n=1 Tax=Paraburkholderia sp. SIMBA_054 TaxID=3085795 RepID=UPI00397C766D
MIAVIDDQDRVLYCKRLTNDLGLILAALAPYQAELEGVVVEATFNWSIPPRSCTVQIAKGRSD